MIQEARNTDTDEGNSVLFCKFEHSYEHKILQEKDFMRPHRKISGIGVSWQKKVRAGGRKFFILFYFLFV